jgi:hypothetical protein
MFCFNLGMIFDAKVRGALPAALRSIVHPGPVIAPVMTAFSERPIPANAGHPGQSGSKDRLSPVFSGPILWDDHMKRFVAIALLGLCLTSQAHAGEQRCTGAARRSPAEFKPLGDGAEILDTRTKLIWRRCIEGQSWTGSTCQADDPRAVNPGPRLSYQAAQAFAAEASSETVHWRLPTAAELETLREPNCYNPSFNLELFPTAPAWSSDGFFWSTTRKDNGQAVISAIGNSDATHSPAPDHVNHARLVRTEKP